MEGESILKVLAADPPQGIRDAILFGSAGDPHIPDHITLWGLRLKICQGFDQYANVRPTRILPGIDAPLKRCGPRDLDWVIVRENSEGEYAGVGGRVHQGHPTEAATDVSMMTRAGVAWQAVGCARGAYESALRYTNERKQFGRTISSFQMVQDLLVMMLSNLTAMQTMVCRLSQLQDNGKLTDEQAAYIGVAHQGPFKAEHYRY